MKRLYLARVEAITAQGFLGNAKGAAWYNILGRQAPVIRSVVDSQAPALYAIGVLDTTTQQHADLIAATNRIIYIPKQGFSVEYQNLEAGAQAKIQAIETFLGFNLTQLTVENIVWIMVGHAVAKGVDNLSDII